MLKELANFIKALDPEFKDIGLEPKEGLHIVLTLEQGVDATLRIADQFDYRLYRKRKTEKNELLTHCSAWARTAWMVDTNKCIDTKTKAIHSASPYCLAIKRTSLNGGETYVTRQSEKKPLVYGSLNAYFDAAIKLLDDETEQQWGEVFRYALNSEEKLHAYLKQIDEWEKAYWDADDKYQANGYREVKDGEYIIFYLNVPLTLYQQVSNRYLGDKLFNTSEHNAAVNGETFGTSAFFNGFPTKKPFLTHQTATFDIAGRISATDALRLFEFKDLAGRGIFPRPLPIFIYEDERKRALALFKEEALKDATTRKSHADIIRELYQAAEQNQQELGNYYLIYYQQGEIKEFDFVSKFEYLLRDNGGKPWKVDDWFEVDYAPKLENVFQFQNVVLPLILNNALVVRTKAKKEGGGGLLLRFFDDIDPQYCKTDNTYLLILKYRQALYDFIYKSKRQALTQKMLEDILLTGILDDLRLDRYENRQHSEDRVIRQKLNVLFSLHPLFQPFHHNPLFMPNHLTELRPFMVQLAAGETAVETDEQFAFAAGQVIYYIQSKSKSEDWSYSRLEPFLQQTDVKLFQQALLKLFDRYKHEFYSKRFQEPMANVIAYLPKQPMKALMPLMLAGFFSKNVLFAEKQDDDKLTEPNDQ